MAPDDPTLLYTARINPSPLRPGSDKGAQFLGVWILSITPANFDLSRQSTLNKSKIELHLVDVRVGC